MIKGCEEFSSFRFCGIRKLIRVLSRASGVLFRDTKDLGLEECWIERTQLTASYHPKKVFKTSSW